MRNIIIFMVLITLTLATGYSVFNTNIVLNAKENVKEKSRIIRSWTSDSTDDFHNNTYRENIVIVIFLDTINIPNNAVQSWDVSADGKGGVMAWITTNNDDNSKYDLYIGAKDGVIANENSSYVFYNFSGISNITFNNNYDTSNVINMAAMFENCGNITTLDLSDFDTSNVENMASMFNCPNDLSSKLEHIIFGSNFITTKVQLMRYMFSDCVSLTELDLSNFNTTKVTETNKMFSYCKKIEKIYASDSFNTTLVTNSSGMFLGSTHLVGGNGTTYDANHTDKEYARIDTASTPGYFTLIKRIIKLPKQRHN